MTPKINRAIVAYVKVVIIVFVDAYLKAKNNRQIIVQTLSINGISTNGAFSTNNVMNSTIALKDMKNIFQ